MSSPDVKLLEVLAPVEANHDQHDDCADSDKQHLLPSDITKAKKPGHESHIYSFIFCAIIVVGFVGTFCCAFQHTICSFLFSSQMSPDMESTVVPYPKVMEIANKFIPKGSDPVEKRLVFIGDVHGMLSELKNLLTELNYNNNFDHLVFTGDLVTKGPDSLEVISFVRENGASCVRGNQDHALLLNYYHRHHNHRPSTEPGTSLTAETTTSDTHGSPNENERKDKKNERKHRELRYLAKKMTKAQAEWLNSCPLILRANGVKGLGNVVVVHAGLVHGVALEDQDPNAVMNMRSIDPHTRVASNQRDGKHWAKLWNKLEKQRNQPTTIIYGHYAARDLELRHFTKGLDTNCVRGGRLTALVVSSNSDKPKVVSVPCKNAVN